MNEHHAFLNSVRAYVSEHPDVGAYVNDFVAHGLRAARAEALERAADMEVALTVAIAARYKQREELILAKLKKWQGRTALRWDDTVAMLEAKKPSNAKLKGGQT
jgi:hypothetical protein